MQIKRGARGGGFTLIEALLVMLFIGTLMAIGVPALQQMIHRSRLEGTARECAVMCQRARLEAIQQGSQTVLRFDTTNHRVLSWVDTDGDEALTVGERVLVDQPLPGTLSIQGPSGTSPIEDFSTDDDGGWIVFFTDGSVDRAGNVHFGDTRGNFLRLRVSPRATAHVEIAKWDENESEWLQPREDKPWSWK